MSRHVKTYAKVDGQRTEVRVVTWVVEGERALVVPMAGGETFEVREDELEYDVVR